MISIILYYNDDGNVEAYNEHTNSITEFENMDEAREYFEGGNYIISEYTSYSEYLECSYQKLYSED